VTYPELAEDLGFLGALKLDFIGTTSSGPQDIQTVASGDSDVGVAFNGAIIKLIAAHAPIKAVVGAYGTDEHTYTSFLVTEDSPIHGARDLIGKRVAMNTLGAHSEIILREYLGRNGLSDEEARQVTLVALPMINIEQALRARQLEGAALMGAFRDKALVRGGLRQVFTDYELFGAFTAGSYVFRQKFIDQHPQTVRTFVNGVAQAIEWTRTTPRETVLERYSAIIAKRHRGGETDEVMRLWKSTAIAGRGGLNSDRDWQLWIDWLEKTGELKHGQFKPAQAYTNEFNPFYSPAAVTATAK
jgi:ABC-type nitrate/sulfonate/bicarbonate transport system substrate-binding protein